MVMIRSPLDYKFHDGEIIEEVKPGEDVCYGLLVRFFDEEHKRVFRSTKHGEGVVWIIRGTIEHSTLK